MLINPEDIANEIHIQQTLSNKPAVPTCYYLPIHPPKCTCAVRQYPWHDLKGLVLEKQGDPQTPLYTYIDLETYNLYLKNLANNKTPGPDKIPNSILKNMSQKFQHILFMFFIQCYKQKQIPISWKTSLTILLYKKKIPHYYPIIDQ